SKKTVSKPLTGLLVCWRRSQLPPPPGPRKERAMPRRSLPAAAALLLLLGLPRSEAGVCSYAQGDFDGNGTQDLHFLTDAGPQAMRIEDSGTSVKLYLDCNDNESYDDPGDVNGVVVNATIETFDFRMGGNEIIRYVATGIWSGLAKNVIFTA